MPVYRYHGRSVDGRSVHGELPAGNLGMAADLLREQQVIPLEITPLPEAVPPSLGLIGLSRRTEAVTLFARQMHTLIRGGVPLAAGLQGVAEGTPHPGLRHVLRQVSGELQSGHGLSSALGKHPELFDGVFVRMVALGEASGTLEEIFAALARYLDAEHATRQRLREAVRYPMYVLFTVGLALAVVHGFVMPAFTGLFQRLGSNLPWATRLLLETSGFLSAHGTTLLLGLAGTLLTGMLALRREELRRTWACGLLRLPLLGPILHQGALARFARGYAMAAGAGLTVVPTLTTVAGVVGNPCLGDAILKMRQRIERGESLLTAARGTGIFPAMVLQMVAVGEEGGALPTVMAQVADHYDREVTHRVQGLSAAMEPLILSLVGGLVLLLAMGVFLPMWELGRAALHP